MSQTKKNEVILTPLDGVRRRHRIQKVFEGVSWGLFLGAVATIPVSLGHLFSLTELSMSFPLLAAVLGIGGLLGAGVGFFMPIDHHDSARRIDRHYRLKDRLLTALKLLLRDRTTPIERLQLADAARHAETVDPREVMPFRLPGNFGWSLTMVALAVAICLASPYFDQRHEAVAAEPLPEIVSAAVTLKEELVEKIEELAEENPEEKQLKELSEKLQELVTQLEEVSTDRKESLATLSEMEEAIRSAMSQFQVEAVDTSMKEIAEALSAAEATRAAAQAMKDEKYAKASDELEKLDPKSLDNMSKQERRAVSEQMKQALKKMEDRGQKSLLNAAKKMAECMECGESGKCKEGACELAGECKKQGLRKGICEGLEGKLSLLGLCKSECNGGGACETQNNGGDNTNKSDKGSKNWGDGAAGNPTSGEETNLDGNREKHNLTGMMGAGDSEYEKFRTDEAPEEKTTREFSEVFKEYQKMSEAVLESEPIPLGQRQMIRRYFESIRPTGKDAE